MGPDCSLPGRPEVFVLGDMAALDGVPGVAQPAIQEGRYVARLVAARLAGAPAPAPFRYVVKGSMATIGHRSAMADERGLLVTGLPAYVLRGLVHVAYLIGWGNRLGTLATWMRALWLGKDRGHRVITFEAARGDARADRTGSGRPAHVLPRPGAGAPERSA